MIYVMATIQLQAGKQEEFLKHARSFIAESRKEKGCLAYDMHVSATDPNRIVSIEQYESDAAMIAHNTSPHLQALVGAVGGLLAAAPQLVKITPASVEPISL